MLLLRKEMIKDDRKMKKKSRRNKLIDCGLRKSSRYRQDEDDDDYGDEEASPRLLFDNEQNEALPLLLDNMNFQTAKVILINPPFLILFFLSIICS